MIKVINWILSPINYQLVKKSSLHQHNKPVELPIFEGLTVGVGFQTKVSHKSLEAKKDTKGNYAPTIQSNIAELVLQNGGTVLFIDSSKIKFQDGLIQPIENLAEEVDIVIAGLEIHGIYSNTKEGFLQLKFTVFDKDAKIICVGETFNKRFVQGYGSIAKAVVDKIKDTASMRLKELSMATLSTRLLNGGFNSLLLQEANTTRI